MESFSLQILIIMKIVWKVALHEVGSGGSPMYRQFTSWGAQACKRGVQAYNWPMYRHIISQMPEHKDDLALVAGSRCKRVYKRPGLHYLDDHA